MIAPNSSRPSIGFSLAVLLTLQLASAQERPPEKPAPENPAAEKPAAAEPSAKESFAQEPSANQPPGPKHWAFVAPVKPPAPVIQNVNWSEHAIDRFVLRKLEAAGLAPSPRASKRTLIRRLGLDLTGLPPTRSEIQEFLADDSQDAYERLVDRLLAKPQYGEHMTRYWLDLVRFADTNGVHHDHYRELTPYRDWVIRSFNQNLPFDRFAIDQIAGDLYPEPTDDQLIASGFHRLHMIIDRGTALPEESLARNVIDRVTAFGTAFMGLTVQCAVCHDHKYDPIKQRDFFSLSAFFNNLDGAAETGSRGTDDFRRGLQRPYKNLPSPQQALLLEQLDGKVQAAKQLLDELQAELQSLTKNNGDPSASASNGEGSRPGREAAQRELEARSEHAKKQWQALRRERSTVLMAVPAAMVMKERAEIRPAHIFIRGDYDKLGERVERDTPSFLPAMKPAAQGGHRSRMDLAEWLVDPAHPLTARVCVNRIWQMLFGVGLVKTAEDFGTQGEMPSHPELLDHLSVVFVESGWDCKALVKQIVLSAVYQQSATATPEAFERDPGNRLLARGSRFRLDAEVIRDQILSTSGLLNPSLYGKSVKPPQPAGIWKAVTLPDSLPRTYVADTGEKATRRSLYTFWKRGMPPAQMSILNAPTRESCIARRERTNTPLQALLLLNESEYLKAARHLAVSTRAVGGSSPAARLLVIYETITSMLPDVQETDLLLQTVRDLRAMYEREPALAKQLCDGIALQDGQSAAELAAWTMLVSVIYNLDVVKTRQ
tara:strand:- start:12491 stop:14809 length:2319 start_codon:yes stop_codon:yes gene_type:complete